MDAYSTGFNLDGQICCNNTEPLHMHSDFLLPTRIDLSLILNDHSDITSSESMIHKFSCSLSRQPDSDKINNRHLTPGIDGTQVQVTSAWKHCIFSKGDNLLIKGCHQDSTCQSTVVRGYEVRNVSSGWDKTVFVDSRGQCHVWKDDDLSKDPLKVKSTDDSVRFSRVSVGRRNVAVVTKSGDSGLIEESGDDFVFCSILNMVKIKEVSCGNEHTLFLTRIGLIFSMGLGSRGQLGHGDTHNQDEPRVVQALEGVSMSTVAAGGWHSTAISDIGDIYVWGWNESGQLGLPSKQVQDQKDSGKSSSLRGREDKNTTDYVNILTLPDVLDESVLEGQSSDVNYLKVSCGSRHTAAMTDAGQVYTWGWNGHGQLGHGDTVSRDTPTLVTYFTEHKLKAVHVVAGSWITTVLVDAS